ncbi:MAG TPA: nitroreductase family protein [Bacteroidales bacterium]|nr:nitroreductase family protein [Bacteroidales bacterium]
MDIVDFITSRRSIRKYTGEPLLEGQIEQLLECGMYAPSAVNCQPWHFIVIDEKELLQKMSEIHPYASMLPGAAAAILVCGDENRAHTKDYWPVDCAAATENILLAAHGTGLGAVWLGIYPREERIEAFTKLFSLPAHIHPFSLISLGYPAEEKKKRTDRFDTEKIHYNSWK